ncbi:MAG TPA: DUF4862 family protein [Propionicimonas sp.]
MSSSGQPAPLLGAYAMAPPGGADGEAFYAGLGELPIGGLELPVGGVEPPVGGVDLRVGGFERGPGVDDARLQRHVRPAWELMTTGIPTVMARLGVDRSFGLSSTDADARARAVADVAVVRDLALRLADRHGRRRVVSIQVHTAPGPGRGSLDALARSLEEILRWDLAGAEVVVEHCDALVVGQPAAKGFWRLEDEVATLRQVVGADDPRVGLSINWGRSAIEGRSARTPVDHIRVAREAGLLRTLVLSGVANADTAWGPAWADAHLPPRGEAPALAASAVSLLDAPAVAEAVRAAGPACRLAVKVAIRPLGASTAARVAVARAAVELVSRSA